METKKRYYAQMMWDQCAVWSIDNHRKKKDGLRPFSPRQDPARPNMTKLEVLHPRRCALYANLGCYSEGPNDKQTVQID